MREARVGRVLVASLHQAIADTMPTRLGFYENWLNAAGLRDGSIGLAPLYAVLSFLRQEGDSYGEVMERAGAYAADWTVASMSPLYRRTVAALPAVLRRRAVLGRANVFVRSTYEGSRARWMVKDGAARVDVRASVFCAVREPVARPQCVFYAAAIRTILEKFDVEGTVAVASCRGTGADACVLHVPFASDAVTGNAEVA